jgi:hypothetical protein
MSKQLDENDKRKTDAAKNFEASLDQIVAFIDKINSRDVLRASRAFRRVILKEIASTPNINAKRIERASAAQKAAVDKWLAFLFPACRWMSVMLVSFLESYLEEGLIGIAVKNPSLIKNADIEKSRIFEVDSIEDLRNEMRLNWAHSALRPGGPETWRKMLRELGAPKFDESTLRKVPTSLGYKKSYRSLTVCIKRGVCEEIWAHGCQGRRKSYCQSPYVP